MQKWAHSGVGKLGVITHQPLNLGQCSPQTPGGLQLVLVGSLGVPTDCGEAGCGIVGTPDPEGSLQDPSPLGLDTPGEIPPRHPHFSYTEAQQATDSVQQIQTLPPEKLRHHTSHGPVRRRWPRTPRAWDTGPPRWLAMEGRPLSQGWPGQGRPFPAGLGTTASLEGGAGTPAQGCRLHTRDRVGPITRSDPQTDECLVLSLLILCASHSVLPLESCAAHPRLCFCAVRSLHSQTPCCGPCADRKSVV